MSVLRGKQSSWQNYHPNWRELHVCLNFKIETFDLYLVVLKGQVKSALQYLVLKRKRNCFYFNVLIQIWLDQKIAQALGYGLCFKLQIQFKRKQVSTEARLSVALVSDIHGYPIFNFSGKISHFFRPSGGTMGHRCRNILLHLMKNIFI